MLDISASTDVGRRPIIYAGRFVDQISGADLPDDCILLGEEGGLAHRLSGIVLEHANALVLLDLLSFPVEAMTGAHWDVPMVVVLPVGFDAESLATKFGSVLFEHLGFFDHIVTSDSTAWGELRRRYRWAESQRVPVMSDNPGEVAKTVRALLGARSTPPIDSRASSVSHDLRFQKGLYRVQTAALEPRFAAARERREAEAPLDVLGVGTGAGRWATSFDPTETRFVGLDAREHLVGTARANFPDQHFGRLGSDLPFPYEDESFDLAFSVTVMHHNPTPVKRTLVSEMWRVTRPGGRLLFLESFVFARQSEEPVVYPILVTEFEDLILEATDNQVVLEHVESLWYPGEDLRRDGLISLFRLGVPKPL